MGRNSAGCTVFEGKIVIAGGFVPHIDRARGEYPTNTVEVYDNIAGTWTYMPDMVNNANNHSLVAIRNKLFVIKYTCEVYDSHNGKFAIIKNTQKISFVGTFRAVSLADKIIVFEEDEAEVISYDVNTNEWKEEEFEIENWFAGCCIKIPKCK